MAEPSGRPDPIARAAAVASDYGTLQGLVTVGAGIGAIVGVLFPPLGAAALIVLCSIARQYYIARYGRVSLTLDRKLLDFGAGVAALLCIGLGVLGDALLRWPVLLTSLGAAAGLVCLYRLNYRSIGVTAWHYVVAALLAASASLPLVGAFPGVEHWRASIGLLGAALVVVGLLDHARLASALRPAAARHE